jgi:hypothetical protein
MTYDPLDPFNGRPPDQAVHYGAASSNPEGPELDQLPVLAGRPAIYRVAFAAMPLKGLPESVQIGRVKILQTPGPIFTQDTYIIQRPGWRPHFDKTMHLAYLEVGEGLHLTLGELAVHLPTEQHIARSFNQWHDEVLAAVSILAVILDDRVAQEELLQDLIVLDPEGKRAEGAMDNSVRVRHFTPNKKVARPQRHAFSRLRDLSHLEGSTLPAARWYLRAAQAGPTPDAIVFLWIALEALTKPPQTSGRGKRKRAGEGKKLDDVGLVEAELLDIGLDPSTLSPSVGQLAGLRADIVHYGQEQPALLHDGFYQLEMLVRSLVQSRLGIAGQAWPVVPGQVNLVRPLRRLAERLEAPPTYTMRVIQGEGAATPDERDAESQS